MPNIGNRIKALIGDEPVSSFARKCGISESLLRQYLAGSVPGLDKARLIADAGEVTLDWLATGRGPMKRYLTFGPSHDELSAGINGDETKQTLCILANGSRHSVRRVDILCFTPEWIRSEFNAESDDICMLVIETVDMEPMLRSGDIILVDHRISSPATDGIYILKIDGRLRVMHIQKLPGEKVKVFSNNTAYKPYEIELNEFSKEHFEVMGQVIWVGKRI